MFDFLLQMSHFCVPILGLAHDICMRLYILRYNWLCDKAFQNTIFCVKDFSFQAPLLSLLLELLKFELSVESYLEASEIQASGGGKENCTLPYAVIVIMILH